jgi:hypothetical protein
MNDYRRCYLKVSARRYQQWLCHDAKISINVMIYMDIYGFLVGVFAAAGRVLGGGFLTIW